MGYEVSGLLGFFVLLLNIWAIMKIVASKKPTLTKVIWIAVVLILPVLGFIVWYFMGPRQR